MVRLPSCVRAAASRGRCAQGDMDDAAVAFDRLDVNKDNVLDITDVREFQDPRFSPPKFTEDFAIAKLKKAGYEGEMLTMEAKFIECASAPNSMARTLCCTTCVHLVVQSWRCTTT